MTTRWKQKISVALAIIAILSLLLLLILLWSAVSNGVLSTAASSSRHNRINIVETSQNYYNNNNNNNKDNNHNNNNNNKVNINRDNDSNTRNNIEGIAGETPSSNNIDQEFNETSGEKVKSNGESDVKYGHEEFIRPMKVHSLPLHTDDLLYESKRNNSLRDDYFLTYKPTGNFRNKSSRIWDPHPEYTIEAFGHRMHLMLYQDTSFVPRIFKVTNIYGNETEVHEDDHNLGCHYKGRVLDDDESVVAVSLCNGMTGHIKTSYGSFFIQPVNGYNGEESDIVHRIWRQSKQLHEISDKLKDRNCPIEDHSKDYNNINVVTTSKANTPKRRRKRDAYAEHDYTLEVLIAVDKKMTDFHKENINSYVLTLMSIVSNIFSDPSIGNSISVAVVSILKIQSDLQLQYIDKGVYASHLLKQFCSYMQTRHDHYDTAILLTREQICRNSTETRCDTLGLAELGTVCKEQSCSIVQDNGLSAAFTIAHELGHILNMPHDDDKKCEEFQRNGKPMLNIMSSTMGNEIHPWSWSDCSRHYVTEFLERDESGCMENPPEHPFTISRKNLPGETYNLDEQCRLIHGPEARHCNIEIDAEKECGRLWCIERYGSYDCRSSNLPWADGTPCKNHHYWCQKGECVRRDLSKLEPIHGGWGSWSEYSQCSRTCGGGIQESERKCDSPAPQNGGRYCSGSRKKYRSCNVQNCAPDVPDFREQQCFELNGNPFGIQGIDRNVRWIPKYGVSKQDECKLFCRVDKSSQYFQLKDKVKDGTTCSFDSFDKCVNGICRPAGCDNSLQSNAKLDRCGICEGKNDTCNEITENFYKTDLIGKEHSRSKFYFDVIRIPKGASNIEITQPGYSQTNYIVLLDDEEKYLLNGDNIINTYRRTFPYAGVSFDYSGANSHLEKVNTSYSRKIKKDLIVQILSLPPRDDQEENEILLTYTYTIDKDHYTQQYNHRVHQYQSNYNYQQHHPLRHNRHRATIIDDKSSSNRHPYQSHRPKKEIYRWEFDEWSSCSSICNGFQRRSVSCVDIQGRRVESSYCQGSTKPSGETHTLCNTHCKLTANVSTTSECNATCGQLGFRQIKYNCLKYDHPSGQSSVVNVSHCKEAHLPMVKYEECHQACWSYTNWSECSRTCGEGVQTRSVVCVLNGARVSDSECPESKRYFFDQLIQRCSTEECHQWSRGEATPCSVSCGVGQRSTPIYCMSLNNTIVDKTLCEGTPMLSPNITNCTMPPCPSEKEIPIRRYYDVGGSRQIHGRNSPERRYSSNHLSNNVEDFPGDAWAHNEWGSCQTDCYRNRTVYCKDSNPSRCPHNRKPKERELCCKIQYARRWSPCSVPCGKGIKKKMLYCAKIYERQGKKPIKREVNIKMCQERQLRVPKIRRQSKKECWENCTWSSSHWSPTCNLSQSASHYIPPSTSISSVNRTQTRTVVCRRRGDKIIDDSFCDQSKKPTNMRKCPTTYQVYRKGACNCNGYQRVRVFCYNENRTKVKCEHIPKPEKQKCRKPDSCYRTSPASCYDWRRFNSTATDGDYFISINRKTVKIYCHDMKSNKPKEYITLNSDDNLSIYYSKRAHDVKSCNSNEFEDDSLSEAGYTKFNKIRLDLNRMEVIRNDFTFAIVHRKGQEYGSAGDCFSQMVNCPRGYFSIDLTDTGFKIKHNTKWKKSGDYSSIKFAEKLDYPFTTVKAHCGGYCGSCFVSSRLELEVM